MPYLTRKKENFSSKVNTKTSMPTVVTAIQHCTGRAIRQEKKASDCKGKVKLLLFADDMILYIENPKERTRKLLELQTTK